LTAPRNRKKGKRLISSGLQKDAQQLSKSYKDKKNALIAMLQEIQEQKSYLSAKDIREISAKLEIPPSQAFSVATFYSSFSLEPQGKHSVHVCMGTACHIKGAENIVDRLARQLHIQAGETTEDGDFSLARVRCLGCCALAPVMRVDQDIYSNVTQEKIRKILGRYS
jgi:NADH-quinone oxidoreductase E subunit